MTDKQQNIIHFIERNTEHRLGENNVSEFIGKYWKEAQNLYNSKPYYGEYPTKRSVIDDYVDKFNDAADRGMSETEYDYLYESGGIYCADDM